MYVLIIPSLKLRKKKNTEISNSAAVWYIFEKLHDYLKLYTFVGKVLRIIIAGDLRKMLVMLLK